MQGLQLATLDIKLSPTRITTELVKELQSLAPASIELEIFAHSDTPCDSRLKLLPGLPIAKLDLSGVVITSAGLAALHGLPLTSLDLQGQKKITDSGLEVLRGMSLLASLNLGSCEKVTTQSLSLLRGLPITQLDVSKMYGETFEDFRALRELLRLADLCIDARYKHVLADLPLTKLSLSRCHDVHMGSMPPMPQLVNLCLDGGDRWGFIDAGLQNAMEGLSLKVLSLHECPRITDAGLEVLRGVPMKWIYFFCCPLITQEGLETFGRVEKEGCHVYVEV